MVCDVSSIRDLTAVLYQQKIAGIIQEFVLSNSLKVGSAVKKSHVSTTQQINADYSVTFLIKASIPSSS